MASPASSQACLRDVYKRQAQVSHESGTAVVTLTAPVEDDTLRRTVEDKG